MRTLIFLRLPPPQPKTCFCLCSMFREKTYVKRNPLSKGVFIGSCSIFCETYYLNLPHKRPKPFACACTCVRMRESPGALRVPGWRCIARPSLARPRLTSHNPQHPTATFSMGIGCEIRQSLKREVYKPRHCAGYMV